MNPETERRLWLGLGAAILALGAAVGVQFGLVQETVVSRVAEAAGVVVGVALALPLVLEGIRPSDEAPTAARYRAAAATVVAAGVAGAVAAGLALLGSVASPIPAVFGAAAAYTGGRAARSWALDGAAEPDAATEADEEAEGHGVETPAHDP